MRWQRTRKRLHWNFNNNGMEARGESTKTGLKILSFLGQLLVWRQKPLWQDWAASQTSLHTTLVTRGLVQLYVACFYQDVSGPGSTQKNGVQPLPPQCCRLGWGSHTHPSVKTSRSGRVMVKPRNWSAGKPEVFMSECNKILNFTFIVCINIDEKQIANRKE
jgi:hypothetical protein